MTDREPPLPPGAAGLPGRLLSGFGALGGTLVLWSLLQFLAVPVFTLNWGLEAYGRWLALTAATGFLSMLDLGLQVHLTSLIRVSAARGDRDGMERILGEGLGLYGGVIFFGFGLLVLAVGVVDLPGRLNLGPEADDAALLLGASALLLLPRGLVGCVFSARGQFSREVYLGSAQQVLPLALQLVAVVAGMGMIALAAIQLAVGLVVGWGALLLALRRWHPDLRLRILWPEASRLRGYAAKSILHFVPTGATTLILHVPVLVLQVLFPAGGAVVVFTTMRTFANLLRQVTQYVAVAAGLEMTRQHAQRDRAGLIRLFDQTSRAGGGLAGLLAGFMFAAGAPFFDVWTHGAVSFDALLAATFILATLAMVPGQCATTLLRHTDHAAPLARLYLLQAVLGCGLLALLGNWWGVLGVAAAVNLAEVLALGLPSLHQAGRLLGVDARRALPTGWGAGLAGLACGFAAAGALASILPTDTLTDLAVLGAAWSLPAALAAPFVLLARDQRARLFKHVSDRLGWSNRR